MKKKILIGSILATLILISMPLISALQEQPVSQKTMGASCGCSSTTSDEDLEEVSISVQNQIDFLESIGGYGTFVQQLQYFLDGIVNWKKVHEFLCLMFWRFVLSPLIDLIKELMETGPILGLIIAYLTVPIYEIYKDIGCSQYDFDENSVMTVIRLADASQLLVVDKTVNQLTGNH